MGMPDDSVCNSVVVFQLLRPTSVFFPFFPLPVVCSGGKNDQAEYEGGRERESVRG